MAINEAVNIDIDVNGVTTVKQAADAYEDLGDAVSQTQLEAERLAQQFGINDKRTQEAIRAAGKYKQEMEELDFAIDAARGGSDQLFRAAQGVTAGFEVAAGAVALFGGQSEELEKVMLKVQGAMVFSQGLKDLKEFGPALLNLAGTIKGKVVTAFTTLRGAIIATGVGALAVGVGVLIANWEKFTNSLTTSFPALKKAGEFIGNLVQKVTDFVGITSEQERMQEKVNESIEKNIEKTDRQIKISQAQGEQEKALNLAKQKSAAELALAKRKFAQDESDDNRKALEDARLNFKLTNIAYDKYLREQKEAEKKQAEERRAEQKRQQEQKAADDKAAADAEFEAWLAQELARYEYDQQLKEEAKKKEDEEFEAFLAQELANYEYRKKLREQEAKEEKEAAAQQVANEKAVSDAKMQLFQLSQEITSGLIGLAGEQTKAGKALALAQIVADTALGYVQGLDIAQKGAKATGPAAPFAFPIFYATQIAAVLNAVNKARQILGSGGGGGASAPSTPSSAAASIPQFRPPTQELPGTEDFTGQNRVYVTEADISNTQNKVKVTEGISTVK